MSSTDGALILHRVALNASFIAIGFALRHLKVLTIDDGRTVFRFATHVTLPALLLYVMTRAAASTSGAVNVMSAIVPATSLLVGLATSFGAYAVYRKSPARVRGLNVGCATGVNLGMFAYPFVEAIWGAGG